MAPCVTPLHLYRELVLREKVNYFRTYQVILRRRKTSLLWPVLMTTRLQSTQMDFDDCNMYKKKQLPQKQVNLKKYNC